MARFEVFIPATEPGSFDVTLRVDALNWMQALKTGFHRLGEQGLVPQNVLVDVQDDGSVHVTDGASGRTFRIRELSDSEVALTRIKPKPTPIGTPVVGPEPTAKAGPVSRKWTAHSPASALGEVYGKRRGSAARGPRSRRRASKSAFVSTVASAWPHTTPAPSSEPTRASSAATADSASSVSRSARAVTANSAAKNSASASLLKRSRCGPSVTRKTRGCPGG